MTEVIFRIPSKVVQYGYVEVRFPETDPDTSVSAERMAKAYLAYVQAFQSTELAELEAEKSSDVKASPAKAKPADETEAMLASELGATKVGVSNPEPWEKETPPASDKPWERAKQQAPVYEPDADLPDFDF